VSKRNRSVGEAPGQAQPTPSAAHLAVLRRPGFPASFRLDRARLLLAVGSHSVGIPDAASDVDFLAVFAKDRDVPREVSFPGVAAMHTPAGPNWVGSLADGQEVNVEMVSAQRLAQFGELLAPPISRTWAPMLQPLDVRLLDRIRNGVPLPVGSERLGASSRYADELRTRLRLDRLPLLVLVQNYIGAVSHLDRANRNSGDPFAVQFGLDAVAAGMTAVTLCIHGWVPYTMKKAPALLARAEQQHPDLPFRVADLERLWLGGDPLARLAAANEAVARLREYVASRGLAGDSRCAEAAAGFTALASVGLR
jgi:hypothetical protein